jgi:hypothetical protein
MKAAIFAASLYAALASATTVSSGQVGIFVQSIRPGGQGATALIATVPFGVLAVESLTEDAIVSVQVREAFGTPIPIESIVCQAYQDAAGTIRIGEPFDSSTLVQLPTGDADDSVQVGSFFCSDAAGVEARNNKPVKRQARTVRVQVNFEGEGAIQIEVPVDNSITRLFGTRLGNSAFITSSAAADRGVSCQAYRDLQATQRVGNRFSVGQTAQFSNDGRDVTVRTLRCRR